MATKDKTYVDSAAWLICPLCDEDNCYGRFHCDQIREKVEEWKRAEAESDCKAAESDT